MSSLKILANKPVQLTTVSKSQRINDKITDLNILLLGETGVGKTTFINSFVNHLIHNTLDEALTGNLAVIIPAAFSITDLETYESKVIRIGAPDTNENNNENGESNTQGCKSYVFPLGNRKLRLIDAPGVGDTRGVDQDAKNFAHILAYISQYKHLDGICILLKPNEQRMNILFRFCVKELLTHLHISAKNNIMFVFTFGRANFYVPGNTASLLKTLLKELHESTGVQVPFTKDNTFTFDNESFRFLATYKNGVAFPDKQIKDSNDSWNKSLTEYGDLVKRIVRCTPHLVRDTISLNEAQQLIRKLHRPMIEVVRLIQENIQLAEQYKVEPQNSATATTINLSDNHISVPQYSGEVIKLPYPRTVCTSKSCTRVICFEGTLKVDYNSNCHEHCYLRDVEQEVINNPALKNCSAMNQKLEICKGCRCSWSTHKHITYEYRTYLSSIDLPLNMNDATNDSSTSRSDQHASSIKSAVNELITKLNGELETMTLVSNKLSRFLRANSITTYNEDTIEYIKHFIGEEQTKKNAGAKNDEVIGGLQASLKAHEEDMKLFKSAIKNDNDDSTTAAVNNHKQVPTIEEIFLLVETLYALPINGNKIRKQVEGLKKSQTENIKHHEQIIQLPSSVTSSMIIDRLTQTLQ